MAILYLHHFHFHHFYLLLLVQSFILNLRLGSSANPFLHRLFTALHVMHTRSSDKNSVCPSVRLSVTRVDCDKTEERSVQIFYTVRKII